MADPDFDLNVPKQALASNTTRSFADGLKLGKVRRLPGTATEAAAVAPKLERFAGVAPQNDGPPVSTPMQRCVSVAKRQDPDDPPSVTPVSVQSARQWNVLGGSVTYDATWGTPFEGLMALTSPAG